ncbi:MAG: aromatic amino acid ammonia-lyase [Pseudomonadota bacterium]|nr:aromatic amino acid ammonia-lyase [Pseudomonadota bacterium]
MSTVVILNGQALTPDHVAAVAHGARVHLAGDARQRMERSAAAYAELPSVLEQKRRYLVGEALAPDGDLVSTFILGHCAGVGDPLPTPIVRALIVCRANVFATGYSGVRPALVEALLDLLNRGITPVVPSQGSVGAAGDLAPLAHVARVLCGLGGAVRLPDGTLAESDASAAYDLPAFAPTHKEALSLINGATLTSALAAIAVHRAERILDAMEVACAMTMEALRADTRCLSLHAIDARGHGSATLVASRLKNRLAGSTLAVPSRSPDAFSIRAAPAVLGAARDALGFARDLVLRELNGACDNPLWIDGEGVVEAGNFHGAPVALACDVLRIALTQAATQSERRTYRLTSGSLTGDLPSFLVEGTGLNSGFMLAQYTAASLASECKGLCHPACVDTIPTVQHHEDHVSMGPIAGRLTLRVLECISEIVGIEALLAAQALDFRRRGLSFPDGVRTEGPPAVIAPGVEAARQAVRAVTPYWEDDQILHPVLGAVGTLVRSGGLSGKGGEAW